MEKVALLFSGYNQRAIVALCRCFARAEQEFAIIAAGTDDTIHLTEYRNNVIFSRKNKKLNMELFHKLVFFQEKSFVYCPTSEFLNMFVFHNASELNTLGIDIGLPQHQIYELLTNKKSSQQVLASVNGVSIPEEVNVSVARAPCVLKPYKNVSNGRVQYPIVCNTENDLSNALNVIDRQEFFSQKYIDGQSYYLCGYIKKDGAFCGYWQENLIQQPAGKSIVLARSCPNPGLNEVALFKAIWATGYNGPIMIEFLRNDDQFFYIETNPRFWGPLQLCLDCSDMLTLYLEEYFGAKNQEHRGMNYEAGRYYAWKFGARQRGLRIFPAAKKIEDIECLLETYDVFRASDTISLHGQY